MAQTDLTAPVSSKRALYRGLIALAWADHELHSDEKSKLHDIVNQHVGLSDEDKRVLNAEIDTPIALNDVWPEMTDPQDRARLIDMSNIIFQQDDAFCDQEHELVTQFQKRHLASINLKSIETDLAKFTKEQAQKRESERAANREWAKQYGLMGMISRLIVRS